MLKIVFYLSVKKLLLLLFVVASCTMASDKTIASVYNALGILFGSAAFGLGISSITSNYWRNGVILNLENTHVGLWNLCFSKNICVEVPCKLDCIG